jgi:hypothetical protein
LTTPWTPVLGDISTPDSISSLGLETAARIAADTALAAAIASIPTIDAYTKSQSDARYVQPQVTLAGYGIGDAFTQTQSDARYVQPQTTLAGYGIGDAYTKTASDSRFIRDIPAIGTDTFPQAASTPLTTLATGQSWVMWSGSWVTTGANQTKESGSVRDAAVVFDSGTTEQDWSVYLSSTSASVGTVGAIVRGVSPGNYIVAFWHNGALTINKMVAGVLTQLATISASGPTASAVYKMRVTATGNVITVNINGPTSTSGTVLSFTLTGSDATFFAGGTFVGNYLTATSGTNAGYLFSNVVFRNYLNAQVTLDARYLRLDEIGQTIAPNAPISQNVIGLNIGSQTNQCAFKVWGQTLFGNNNDAINNSTGSGFLHLGSFSGVTLGLGNGTVHLKAVAAGISSPVAPFIQTTGGAPALATSSGVAGQFAWDASNFYVCVAANTWKRVAIATF